MSNSIYQQTEQNLTALKLNQMKVHLEETSNNVGSGSMSFTEGLLKLTNYELDFKENSASQNTIHAAAFPFLKTLMDFDFTFQPSVNENQMREFCALGFMERAENIVFLGSSGVGKTHLATAIGISAARHHNITYFIKCHDLLQQLKIGLGELTCLRLRSDPAILFHHCERIHAREHDRDLRLIIQPVQAPLRRRPASRMILHGLARLLRQHIHQLAAAQRLHDHDRDSFRMRGPEALRPGLRHFVQIIILDLAEIPIIILKDL